MREKTKKNRKRRRVAPAGLILISVAALGGVWFADAVRRAVNTPSGSVVWQDTTASAMLENTTKPEETNAPVSTTEPTEPVKPTETIQIQDAATDLFEAEEETLPEGFVSVPMDEAGIYTGSLLQIDQNHPYSDTVGELTTFHGKNTSYRMKRLDFNIRPVVLEAMNEMGNAYVADTGTVNLMIYSTMAPYDAVGSLYPDALPDRSSGYCLDFCILNSDETINKIKEPNAWLKEHAWEYGFVFSYTEADAAESGVAAAPYHLRYIGKVHAGIMHEQGLSLAGYFNFLKGQTVDVPLYYTIGETEYTVYYVPSEGASTEVPVPSDMDYEISGNNSDGYIVTAVG